MLRHDVSDGNDSISGFAGQALPVSTRDNPEMVKYNVYRFFRMYRRNYYPCRKPLQIPLKIAIALHLSRKSSEGIPCIVDEENNEIPGRMVQAFYREIL